MIVASSKKKLWLYSNI